jgi:hypothetical protein
MTVKLMRIEKNHIPAAKGNCQRNQRISMYLDKGRKFCSNALKKEKLNAIKENSQLDFPSRKSLVSIDKPV